MNPLVLIFLVGAAALGPIFKKDAAKGFKVQKSKTNDLDVSLTPCKMVEDCGSLDVSATKLLVDTEDGKMMFENPQRITVG